MGLVDYASDSDSDSTPAAAPAPKQPSTATSKKPFQKVVDRSNPGKILVNLPQTTPTSAADEPPAKRARTGDGSGGRFSGFNSFLPAPKNANKPKPAAASGNARARPGVNLKTSSAAAFSRDDDNGVGDLFETEDASPRKQDGPSIPAEQKPAEEVKLVGKPMMFKPLSVSRNPKKKKAIPAGAAPTAPAPNAADPTSTAIKASTPADPAPQPPPKKTSLFSMHTEEPSEPKAPSNGTYQPFFAAQGPAPAPAPTTYDTAAPANDATSLTSIANDLNLTAAQRRELFGRSGEASGQMAKSVINFNMDREYQHNEEVRASGETAIHNPVRAIQGGKHSLRQLVSNVQNQKEALEDSFAKGRNNKKEASGKYGW